MTTDSNKPPSDDEDPPLVALKTKFLDWWEGYETPSGKRRRIAAAEAASRDGSGSMFPGDRGPQPGMNRFGKPLWTATRLEVAEKIWGAGYITPGGDELITTLAKPLGLNPAMTALEVGCGLGGACRCLARQFGSWFTGLEASPFLVEQGMERSAKAKLAKQAPIQLFDPENFKFGKRVDAVISKDAFFTIRNKTGLFDRIERILKPRGQFLCTDYIVAPEARNTRPIKTWSDREPLEPQLWTLQGALDAFAQCNFDLRIQEDITDNHVSMILTSIKAFTEHLEQHHLDKETKVNVIDEVETWAQRVSALHSGLRCYRFYAIKPPE
jgi:SAM-dependent methyltransferase